MKNSHMKTLTALVTTTKTKSQMKKALLFVIVILSLPMLGNAQAQEKLNLAKQNLQKYYQQKDVNTLVTARNLINTACNSPQFKQNPDALITKGNIYLELASITSLKLYNNQKMPEVNSETLNYALLCFMTFHEADKFATKKADKSLIIKRIQDLEHILSIYSILLYKAEYYSKAFFHYYAALGVYKMLRNKGESSILNDTKKLSDHYLLTAVSGYYGKEDKAVKPVFKEMIRLGFDDNPFVYEGLYNILVAEGNTEAEKYLSMGSAKFPNHNGLLFKEINHYLKEGKLEKTLEKLEIARKREPNNISVWVTIGQVNDEFNKQFRKAGKTEMANKYFDEAAHYFQQSIQKDSTNFDALYSLGALYYNRAASMTDEVNKWANDLSAEGIKIYEQLELEMMGYYLEALPFFEKALDLKPGDRNTLIALNEIFSNEDKLHNAIIRKAFEELGQKKKETNENINAGQ